MWTRVAGFLGSALPGVVALTSVAAQEPPRGLLPEDGPAPGIYLLRPVHAPDRCLGYTRSSSFRQDYLAAGACHENAEGRLPHIAILPHPLGGFTLRPATLRPSGRPTNVTESRRPTVVPRRGLCASVGRGVIFGPAAIDVRACELPEAASSWCQAGIADQRFTFRTAGPGRYEIRTPDSQCIDIRNDGTEDGAEAIRWECHAGENQRFDVTLQRPLVETDEAACVKELGWMPGPDGHRWAVPVAGIDLAGGDYWHFTTANDGGLECALTCVGDPRCRSFTWVRPGLQDKVSAVCWLKDRGTRRMTNPDTASGIVRFRDPP